MYYRLLFVKYYATAFFSKKIQNQKGQTLVEFVLLLAVISGLSFMFLKLINGNLSLYWTFIVQKIIDDPEVKLNL